MVLTSPFGTDAGVMVGPFPAAAATNSSISASALVSFRNRSLSSGIMTGACLVRRLNGWCTGYQDRTGHRSSIKGRHAELERFVSLVGAQPASSRLSFFIRLDGQY